MGPFYQYIEDIIGMYSENYDVIFQTIYENGTYNILGITFLVMPLVLLSLFYFLWKYPYGKLLHWFLYIIIISIIVGFTSWQIAYSGIFNSGLIELDTLLNNNTDGYEDFAYTLLPRYSIINGTLAMLASFIYSLILKQKSKLQIHLPF